MTWCAGCFPSPSPFAFNCRNTTPLRALWSQLWEHTNNMPVIITAATESFSHHGIVTGLREAPDGAEFQQLDNRGTM